MVIMTFTGIDLDVIMTFTRIDLDGNIGYFSN